MPSYHTSGFLTKFPCSISSRRDLWIILDIPTSARYLTCNLMVFDYHIGRKDSDNDRERSIQDTSNSGILYHELCRCHFPSISLLDYNKSISIDSAYSRHACTHAILFTHRGISLWMECEPVTAGVIISPIFQRISLFIGSENSSD